MSSPRKIRMGMIGGGPGSMIGPIHRAAANLDGQIELVCGVFSSKPEVSQQLGRELFLSAERCYASFEDMMEREAQLPPDERMDFVAVVTPNHLHFPVARLAMQHGFHVLSDKPATLNFSEAEQLAHCVKESGLLYGLTHTYAGYPMIKQARDMVREGRLGRVRKVLVEYPQGWLSQAGIEGESKQAEWRLDPARSGASTCVGDIGSHAAHLSEYVTGSAINAICADLGAVVESRKMDDDATILLRFDNGARGVLIASQICAGEENNLKIRVYGEAGGLEWNHTDPNTLLFKPLDRNAQIIRAGGPEMTPLAAANCRTPGGHPEGYLEAFANHYRNFAGQVRARLENRAPTESEADVPGLPDALRGMRFIESAVKASASEQKWYSLPDIPFLQESTL